MYGKFSAQINHRDDQIEMGSCVSYLMAHQRQNSYLLKSYLRNVCAGGSGSQNSLRSSCSFITLIQYCIHLESWTSYPTLNQVLEKHVRDLGKLLSLNTCLSWRMVLFFFFAQVQTESIKGYYWWGRLFLLYNQLDQILLEICVALYLNRIHIQQNDIKLSQSCTWKNNILFSVQYFSQHKTVYNFFRIKCHILTSYIKSLSQFDVSL